MLAISLAMLAGEVIAQNLKNEEPGSVVEIELDSDGQLTAVLASLE